MNSYAQKTPPTYKKSPEIGRKIRKLILECNSQKIEAFFKGNFVGIVVPFVIRDRTKIVGIVLLPISFITLVLTGFELLVLLCYLQQE
jgi:predicted branched-subunit amino acid permease